MNEYFTDLLKGKWQSDLKEEKFRLFLEFTTDKDVVEIIKLELTDTDYNHISSVEVKKGIDLGPCEEINYKQIWRCSVISRNSVDHRSINFKLIWPIGDIGFKRIEILKKTMFDMYRDSIHIKTIKEYIDQCGHENELTFFKEDNTH